MIDFNGLGNIFGPGIQKIIAAYKAPVIVVGRAECSPTRLFRLFKVGKRVVAGILHPSSVTLRGTIAHELPRAQENFALTLQ